MASDADWVADVRRWYLAGLQAKVAPTGQTNEAEAPELGYEAAHPPLQARHWPDAASGDFSDPK